MERSLNVVLFQNFRPEGARREPGFFAHELVEGLKIGDAHAGRDLLRRQSGGGEQSGRLSHSFAADEFLNRRAVFLPEGAKQLPGRAMSGFGDVADRDRSTEVMQDEIFGGVEFFSRSGGGFVSPYRPHEIPSERLEGSRIEEETGAGAFEIWLEAFGSPEMKWDGGEIASRAREFKDERPVERVVAYAGVRSATSRWKEDGIAGLDRESMGIDSNDVWVVVENRRPLIGVLDPFQPRFRKVAGTDGDAVGRKIEIRQSERRHGETLPRENYRLRSPPWPPETGKPRLRAGRGRTVRTEAKQTP